MLKHDWDAEAKRAANHFRENHHEAHRGAMPWQTLGVCVVFGNDSYRTDERTRFEVELVRQVLTREGIKELGFGLSDEDSGSWAMMVQTDDHRMLVDLVWDAWLQSRDPHSLKRKSWSDEAKVFRYAQQKIALTQITDAGNEPTASTN